MLLLTESDVKSILTMDEVIKAVTSAYLDYGNRQIDIPSRITIQVRSESESAIFLVANYHSMPYYGIKQASSFASNKNRGKGTVLAEIHLYSADTGEVLAVISATHLTAMKTGAASAVATRFLAREKENAILSIIGTGVQAQMQLAGIERVVNIKEVRIYDIDKQRSEKFLGDVRGNQGGKYDLIISPDADSCVSDSDIVVTTTTSCTPVFSGDRIDVGTHINAVGSFTPFMQEIDARTIKRADKIVTDNKDEAMNVAGDLLVPLRAGEIEEVVLYGELADIIAGKIPGRESDREITIYESVGFGALDIAVAIATYRKALEQGKGIQVEWS
jgi:ornithine cyclodeaminase